MSLCENEKSRKEIERDVDMYVSLKKIKMWLKYNE